MDRDAARRLLGVREGASEAELHAAYWALRAHVEERAHGSPSAGFRAERARELHALDEALRLLAPRRVGETSSRLAWPLALGAVALCGALVLWLARGVGQGPPPGDATAEAAAMEPGPPEGEPDQGGQTGSASSAEVPPEPARLAVRANVEGARLELQDPGSGERLAEGPADGSEISLPAGSYGVAVRHPDCPDTWSSTLELAAGERREVDAQVCTATGFLIVRSNVPGDRLVVDDEPRGSTGPTRYALPAGDHRVRVEKEGFAAWSAEAAIRPAELLTLHADLRSTAPPPPPRPAAAATSGDGDDAGFPQRVESMREDVAGWHAAVRQRMLARWDKDGSGRIDTEQEVLAIPCTEWRELEKAYDQGGLAVPMSRLYGFDGSAWLEGALGFSFPVRDLAYKRMKECGLR